MKMFQVEVTLGDSDSIQSVRVDGIEIKVERGDAPGKPDWWPIFEKKGMVVAVDVTHY